MFHRHLGLLLVGITMTWSGATTQLDAQTIHVALQGKPIEGKPVFYNDQFVALLQGDGRITTFTTQEAQDYRKLGTSFRSLSQSEMRGALLREFGKTYEVSGTGQYLVVHPAGQRDLWADRFEDLYRQMMHYFSTRRFQVHRPEFPLVAIVFPSQDIYLRHVQQNNVRVSANTLGFYDPTSNRIYMFDSTAHDPNPARWYQNAETIIHEATHQAAYNVGIHNRTVHTPRWVVEGLGTMFEARGVWNARHFPQRPDRINVSQLKIYRQAIQGRSTLELLHQQISSDQLFQTNMGTAYAHAWALTFFLTEVEPRRYADLLQATQRLPPYQEYRAEARLKDFARIFGGDLKMFDVRMQRFIGSL